MTTMPFQNRVDPFGDFLVTEARGALMGNRGILHDGERRIVRRHVHQNWVACGLNFKDRRRTIMAPGKYTELFFLDEATAFAAGHRPCAECRRARYAEFTQIWRQVHAFAVRPSRQRRRLFYSRLRFSRLRTVSAPRISAIPNAVITSGRSPSCTQPAVMPTTGTRRVERPAAPADMRSRM